MKTFVMLMAMVFVPVLAMGMDLQDLAKDYNGGLIIETKFGGYDLPKAIGLDQQNIHIVVESLKGDLLFTKENWNSIKIYRVNQFGQPVALNINIKQHKIQDIDGIIYGIGDILNSYPE